MTADRQAALALVVATLGRCRSIWPKFAPGSSQHSLLKNRIRALEIAAGLLSDEGADASDEELCAALLPLDSIYRKCDKARSKYAPDTAAYRRYDSILHAMKLSCALINDELQRRQTP